MTDRRLLSPRENLLEAQSLLDQAAKDRSPRNADLRVERAKAHAMIAHAIAALESRPC